MSQKYLYIAVKQGVTSNNSVTLVGCVFIPLVIDLKIQEQYEHCFYHNIPLF